MLHSEQQPTQISPQIDNVLECCEEAVQAANDMLAIARERVAALTVIGGKLSNQALETHQTATHGLSWMATYVESLRQMLDWANRLDAADQFGEMERLILQIAFGEYLWQLYGGLPMSQGELLRPQDVGLSQEDQRGMMVTRC